MTDSPETAVQFRIELVGMPEAFAARRRVLVDQFQEGVIAVYGSEDTAAGALHAYLDAGEVEPDEVPWDIAHARVVTDMGLPPGARFRCSLAGLSDDVRLDRLTGQPIQPFTVALEDAPSLPAAVRINAEGRYAAALERALGGREAVATVYRAWLAANEYEMSSLDKETANAALKWPKAAAKALEAGMHRLGELPGAHFEIRLARA